MGHFRVQGLIGYCNFAVVVQLEQAMGSVDR